MFKVTRTQYVLAVDDFKTAVEFFTGKPGFALNRTIGGWAFLQLGNFYLMIGDCRGEMPARATGNHSLFAYVNCQDIDELYRQYQDRGVIFRQKFADKPWGLREFEVETPEDHRMIFGETLNV